ncbi:hypothetical protein BCR44DRAFT_65656 [Catenaria anguillulae PL171]|uniref:DEAD/DEAH-box helicase domain-containing protein n=1 Tax=Catenaria anguillulae PL171 TaxID=765915 RepID=A0A1Y2H3G6_9FUNG|nr:hypothetical protein BCR44DRAFT_65656 [Catenaria anguillulae PL171]
MCMLLFLTTTSSLMYLGIEQLRPDQIQVIQSALDGKDSIVAFPTIYGKSACFQLLPKLSAHKESLLSLSPLLALAT